VLVPSTPDLLYTVAAVSPNGLVTYTVGPKDDTGKTGNVGYIWVNAVGTSVGAAVGKFAVAKASKYAGTAFGAQLKAAFGNIWSNVPKPSLFNNNVSSGSNYLMDGNNEIQETSAGDILKVDDAYDVSASADPTKIAQIGGAAETAVEATDGCTLGEQIAKTGVDEVELEVKSGVAEGLSDMTGPLVAVAMVIVRATKKIVHAVQGNVAAVNAIAVDYGSNNMQIVTGTSNDTNNRNDVHYWDGTCWTSPGNSHCDDTTTVTEFGNSGSQVDDIQVQWQANGMPRIVAAVNTYNNSSIPPSGDLQYYNGTSWVSLFGSTPSNNNYGIGTQNAVTAISIQWTETGVKAVVGLASGTVYYNDGSGNGTTWTELSHGTMGTINTLDVQWQNSGNPKFVAATGSDGSGGGYVVGEEAYYYSGSGVPIGLGLPASSSEYPFAMMVNWESTTSSTNPNGYPQIIVATSDSSATSNVSFYNGSSWNEIGGNLWPLTPTQIQAEWPTDGSQPSNIVVAGNLNNIETLNNNGQVMSLQNGSWSLLSGNAGTNPSWMDFNGTNTWYNAYGLEVMWPDQDEEVAGPNPTILVSGGFGSSSGGGADGTDSSQLMLYGSNWSNLGTSWGTMLSDSTITATTTALSILNTNQIVTGDNLGNVWVYTNGLWSLLSGSVVSSCSSNNLNSVTYGNGVFVAVGNSGAVVYGFPGQPWY
jgi:hypothetical protein